MLFDNVTLTTTDGGNRAGLKVENRRGSGSGHGWAAGFSILWNCVAPQILVQQPTAPFHYNWAIGGLGTIAHRADDGIFDTFGQIVDPGSLYLQQLRERLGDEALAAIGY